MFTIAFILNIIITFVVTSYRLSENITLIRFQK